MARTLQQSVSIPVIGVGRLDRPAEFQAAVEDGHVQLAGVGRALIADPEFVNKISEGRLSEIRPCIACNHCLACLHWGEPVKCVVNPYVGRDLLKPAITTVPRKVVVVGGGPAGLTAAATAAKCGVRVVLIEKSFRLGGTLHIAKRPPFKEPIADFIAYLVAEAQKVGVEILLGQSINESLLKGLAPDEIIWAAGAEAVSPDLACLDEQCVLMAEGVLSCDKIKPGQYLVLGGGMVGLETAEYLCARGGIVTVMEMLDELGRGLGPMRQKLILDRLIRAGVNLFTRAKVISIENRMVEVELPCGNAVYGPFDAVVLASGYRPNQSRVQTLEDIAPVHIIGDARQVRSILEAVSEGMETALGLGQTAS